MCMLVTLLHLQDSPRIQGLKVYDEVGEEQVMVEVAAAWGSTCKVRQHTTEQQVLQDGCSLL